MNLGLYIGCGTDVEILSKLPEIRSCIFIDSMHLTGYGDLYHNKQDDTNDISKTYMVQFNESAQKAGFIKINIDHCNYIHIYLYLYDD